MTARESVRWVQIALTCTVGLLFHLTATGSDSQLSGRVSEVISGNQVVLVTDTGVRLPVILAGVLPPTRSRQWQAAARRFLGTLTLGRAVEFSYAGNQRQQPLLGRLWLGGSDLNIRLLQAGLGRYTAAGLSPTGQSAYRAAEQTAKSRGQGIWR